MECVRSRFVEEVLPVQCEKKDELPPDKRCPPEHKPCNGTSCKAFGEALKYPYGLRDLVQAQSGDIPCRVRDFTPNGEGHFWDDHTSDDHHNHVTLNSIGKPPADKAKDSCPYKVAIDVRNHFETLFPGGAKGLGGKNKDGQPNQHTEVIEVGNRFSLTSNVFGFLAWPFDEYGSKHGPQVEVTEVTDYDFRLDTVLGSHPLVGTAIHGVLRDCTGEVWMFQQGTGKLTEKQIADRHKHPWNPAYYPGDAGIRRGLNNGGANLLWMDMARQLRKQQGYTRVVDNVPEQRTDPLGNSY